MKFKDKRQIKHSIDWLLVDGYNMLYFIEKNVAYEELENIRQDLNQKFVDYCGFYNTRLIIVYDGQGIRSEEIEINLSSKIIYTADQVTADSWIESETARLTKKGWRVQVVTSDRAEQQMVFGAGALRISVREMTGKLDEFNNELDFVKKNLKTQGIRKEIYDRLDETVLKKLESWRREN